MEAPSVKPYDSVAFQDLFGEIRHLLGDEEVDNEVLFQELETAHSGLETERLGNTTGMPMPLLPRFYQEEGKRTKLAEKITEHRNSRIEESEETVRLRTQVVEGVDGLVR